LIRSRCSGHPKDARWAGGRNVVLLVTTRRRRDLERFVVENTHARRLKLGPTCRGGRTTASTIIHLVRSPQAIVDGHETNGPNARANVRPKGGHKYLPDPRLPDTGSIGFCRAGRRENETVEPRRARARPSAAVNPRLPSSSSSSSSSLRRALAQNRRVYVPRKHVPPPPPPPPPPPRGRNANKNVQLPT